jgi:spermidine synthase
MLIYEGKDEFGPVEVIKNEGLRSLHFGTSNKQSEMVLFDPYALTIEYTRLMSMALLFQPSPKNVLILGLGGGSLAKFIWKYFPQCHLHLVERSALVIDICTRYFALPKSSRLHTHCVDAFDFLKSCEIQFDLIFIDLFQGEGMSLLLAQSDFFRLCKKCLHPKRGMLVWNTWRQTPERLMVDSITSLCESFGKNMLILPDSQEMNNVFLIFTEINYHLSQIIERAQQLERKQVKIFRKFYPI